MRLTDILLTVYYCVVRDDDANFLALYATVLARAVASSVSVVDVRPIRTVHSTIERHSSMMSTLFSSAEKSTITTLVFVKNKTSFEVYSSSIGGVQCRIESTTAPVLIVSVRPYDDDDIVGGAALRIDFGCGCCDIPDVVVVVVISTAFGAVDSLSPSSSVTAVAFVDVGDRGDSRDVNNN